MAARALFVGKGYDEATMREIARLADVGLGTLFLYAADKRDLLFLAYDDEHARIVRAITSFCPSSDSLLKDLTSYFRTLYDVFASEPDFSRYILREVTFYHAGPQATRATATRRQIIQGLERLLATARQAGQLSSPESDDAIAQLLFGVFQAEVRVWLADAKPAAARGIRRLQRMFGILVQGIQPAPQARSHVRRQR